MKQDKQDRRSLRTRNLIIDAMLELLFEKRYESITVQDILDRADIGRSTFYTHYYDKEDVLASIAEEMLGTFSQQFSQRNVEQEILPGLELFEHVQQHSQYFQAMLRGYAGEVLWDATQNALSNIIEQALVATYGSKPSPSIPWSLIAQYLSGAFLSLLRWWLNAEMPYTPEQMEKIFQQLALPGILNIAEGERC
ncbi:MAG TPA: TetR/AcrR family transcriptional regulator [Ktedonobacteraceae bacterium]|nr:TetR/AcrR family transcriptional regulator [Ktedonobacteraceae bacterium]